MRIIKTRNNLMFVALFWVLLALNTGCAGVEELTPGQLGSIGAVGGAVVTKTVEKTKKIFTPHYRLLKRPLEICDITDMWTVTCFLAPCPDNHKCSITYKMANWIKDNPKIITVKRSLLASVVAFCEKNPNACLNYVGYYKGEKIIIVSDDK